MFLLEIQLEIWYLEIFQNNDKSNLNFFVNLSTENLKIFQNGIGLNMNFLTMFPLEIFQNNDKN